jgi:hypothetical protein
MRFAPAVFLSALLLFLMQSVAGKQLLPWFGGAPGTWAACLMFFQTLLLAGYGYAWALDRWCPARWQRGVHSAVMILAAAQLAWWAQRYGVPLLAPEVWKPQGHEAPLGLIIKALATGTGLPFVVLAATSPLLQRWAAEDGLPPARIYRLYAISNAGSLMGLLGFPFLLEPKFSLPALAVGWGWAFGILTLAAAAAMFLQGSKRRTLDMAPSSMPLGGMSAQGDRTKEPEPANSPASAGRKTLWVLLSAVASAVLLATTNQLCQEIAMVPFLWVLPLALYLVAFMLAFHDARWYRREWLAAPAGLLSLVALGFAIPGTGIPVSWVMIVLGAWLFLFCWMCLGELFRLRPPASGLTVFYLAIAFGGALGSAAVAVTAPLLLSSVTEFPWSMFLGWLLLGALFWRDRTSLMHRGDVRSYAAVVFFGITGLMLLISLILPDSAPVGVKGWMPAVAAGTALTMLFFILTLPFPGWQRWRGWPQLLIGLVIFFAFAFTLDDSRGAGAGVLAKGRNFYGAVRAQADERQGVAYVRLVHGQVNHGIQFTDPILRRQPAGYCDPDSGVGIAIAGHPRRINRPPGQINEPMRIGVAGLGVGAMAAYLRPGDVMRFYEVNPLVIEYAAGPDAFFSYIKDSRGTVETVTGDARLALERELRDTGPQLYDILILDAFSSDSVPVHLLTVEAFALYLRHLRDADSLLAVNISNRYLDFRPLIRNIARHFQLHARLYFHPGRAPIPTPNLWMMLTPGPVNSLQSSGDVSANRPIPSLTPGNSVLWTDTHSDVFSLLRWTSAPLRGLAADTVGQP